MPAQKTITPKKVLCFGELLLRMSPRNHAQWIQDQQIAAYVGGAELNVATALAKWEIPSKYITALPAHDLSMDLVKYLGEQQIDHSALHFSGSRIGIYFLPQGSDLKNSGVIYDRAHSSFSELRPGQINWNEALRDVCWLHFSAISPALNKQVADVCEEAVKAASKKGITVSLDLNYRAKLWKYGKEPASVMPRLARHCDLIMGNIWAAEKLLGIPVKLDILKKNSKKAYLEHAVYTSESIMKQFPKVKNVANTFRFDRKGNAVSYYASLYHDGRLYASDEILANEIRDKIGTGDCFMSGLIYGFYKNMSPDQIVNYAAVAAVGKMYETSDATSQSSKKIFSDLKRNSQLKHRK